MRWIWLISLLLCLLVSTGRAQQSSPVVDFDDPSRKDIHPPKPLNNVEAEFSPEARSKAISGRCLVVLTVDTTGLPEDIHLVRCTDPAFAHNSLSAVSKYRFAPATKQDGSVVAFKITVDINFMRDDRNPILPIRYGFGSPANTTSTSPDASGVYPLTKLLAPPVFRKFFDAGYGDAAFSLQGKGGCDVVLTINEKGKPSDPGAVHCEKAILEKPAVQSLLKSSYKPATLNGKAVPVRITMHLELGDFPPIQ